MKGFAFFASKSSATQELRIPTARIARLNSSLKRRLDDDVEDVFNRACATNDLESANDLLAILEKWHERRASSYGRERRISGASLERTRRELDRLIKLKREKDETKEPVV